MKKQFSYFSHFPPTQTQSNFKIESVLWMKKHKYVYSLRKMNFLFSLFNLCLIQKKKKDQGFPFFESLFKNTHLPLLSDVKFFFFEILILICLIIFFPN